MLHNQQSLSRKQLEKNCNVKLIKSNRKYIENLRRVQLSFWPRASFWRINFFTFFWKQKNFTLTRFIVKRNFPITVLSISSEFCRTFQNKVQNVTEASSKLRRFMISIFCIVWPNEEMYSSHERRKTRKIIITWV
jgi:hypothetical protein